MEQPVFNLQTIERTYVITSSDSILGIMVDGKCFIRQIVMYFQLNKFPVMPLFVLRRNGIHSNVYTLRIKEKISLEQWIPVISSH
jgi:hypothetical protein